MWIFGYGSLMWDGWEKEYDGKKYDRAVLHGYSRAFNKKSVKNWGSGKNPCPTLGLEVGKGVKCVGAAFELPDDKGEEVLRYLRKREGNSFKVDRLTIELLDGRRVEAYTLVNNTKRNTYLKCNDARDLARMVESAEGTSGKCSHYVANIRRKLSEFGIEDEAVEKLWKSIQAEDLE